MKFTHLHVHSQYSILDGAAPITQLVKKAKKDGMPAIALTDHGVMHGIKEFHCACKAADIKPILGCECYMVDDIADKKDRTNHHIILLAKNETGYRHLIKMVTVASIDGFYYKPRIDRKLLKENSEGIIVSTACLGGEIPQYLMQDNPEKAEERILWFKEIFGADFYLELQRHPNNNSWDNVWANQQKVNKYMVELAHKLDVKLIATNDSHFVNKEDAAAHDLLVCMNTGRDFDDPKRMRYTRQEWFKTTAEMREMFSDLPEAIENTNEIADKVEFFELDSTPFMPEFPIPASFATWEEYQTKFEEAELIKEFKFAEDETDAYTLSRLGGYQAILRIKFEADYLSYLTYIGAEKRYGKVLNEVQSERIIFELDTIKKMGFPGYFLIVQDFIAESRSMGVLVGPGRGSAAGAVVAYALKITNLDPLKYDLLFERFLNPDRISMPDIDIDFDDDGRQKVMNWVTEKYGADKVAHICTFGSMAAKSAIKDVARVLKLPLSETNRMTKDFPENGKLKGTYQLLEAKEKEGIDLESAAAYWKRYIEQKDINPKDFPKADVLDYFVTEIKESRRRHDRIKEDTLRYACALEGSVRQTGIHACGILIGKNPLVQHLPLMQTKGENLLNTQYDGRFVEDIGLLKMDFLGLKTLSIIKETLVNVKNSTGLDIDIDNISLSDEKTFKMFCEGGTTAIFQFESPGMKKNLRSLKPNRFEDLVAMNALYRPGPMEYIPNYIARKLGQEEVAYDHPLMEKYLSETYGITVFQEQVMLLSRRLGNFTRGESDSLRKAMGKKKLDMMAKLKAKFIEGCINNPLFMEGYEKEVNKKTFRKPEDLVEKIWKDWEAFAAYAFNKSHSVCYAFVAYQTAYLKAHYPAEFMAGILSCNLGNAEKIAIFMDECRQMGMEVLGPDVNESLSMFTVNEEGAVRFGMSGIKGAGQGAVENIIAERKANGKYKDIFDFAERVNLSAVNKKTWESLAYSGGFDNLDSFKREDYFSQDNVNDKTTFINKIINYGHQIKLDREESANSLFGDTEDHELSIKKPEPAPCETWSNIYRLNQERDLIGIYISDHPLNLFKYQVAALFDTRLKEFEHLENFLEKSITTGGIITNINERLTKNNVPFGLVTIEDHNGSFEFAIFGEKWAEFRGHCSLDVAVMIKGKSERRRSDPNTIDFRINELIHLSTVNERYIKGLHITLPYKSVTSQFVDLLYDMLHSGVANEDVKRLKFTIVNDKNGDKINLISGNFSLFLSKDLLDKLSEITILVDDEESNLEDKSQKEIPLKFALNS